MPYGLPCQVPLPCRMRRHGHVLRRQCVLGAATLSQQLVDAEQPARESPYPEAKPAVRAMEYAEYAQYHWAASHRKLPEGLSKAINICAEDSH